MPAEIAALPHVESSFNPAAYSKVGAAGLWQFMPSTAKRFMRVDGIVDERLDPYSATEAAANLMLYNYRLLGSWPLAVTAYNHGPGGLRRAQDELGTSDIAVIVKRYQGATFGFASRNFYVAFLAALEVDRNAEKYFGPLTRLPDTENTPVELPDYIAVGTLAKAFKVDLGALKVLNPALRPPIWNGSRLVPRGYALRLAGRCVGERDRRRLGARADDAALRGAAQRRQPSGAQGRDLGRDRGRERRERGASPRRRTAGAGAHAVARGEIVRIPSAGDPRRGVGSSAGERGRQSAAAVGSIAAESSGRRSRGGRGAGRRNRQRLNPRAAENASSRAALAAQKIAAPPREPVTRRQTESAALLPAGPPTGGTDATDYGVAADDTVVVQVGETLGHFADWSGVDSQRLRALNRLHKSARVTVGRKIKLDLSKVTAEQFRRRGASITTTCKKSSSRLTGSPAPRVMWSSAASRSGPLPSSTPTCRSGWSRSTTRT